MNKEDKFVWKKYDPDRIKAIREEYNNKGNFQKTVHHLVEYINQYPTDISGLLLYGKCLLKLGMFDELNDILDKVEKIGFNGIKLHQVTWARLKSEILLRQHKFHDALCVYEDNEEVLRKNTSDYDDLIYQLKGAIYCYRVMDRGGDFCEASRYLDDFELQHIAERHTGEFNLDEDADDIDSRQPSKFFDGFPIDKALETFRKDIPNNNGYKHFYLKDFYIYHCPDCGISDGIKTDYIKVVAMADTNCILSFYPYTNKEGYKANELYLDIPRNDKQTDKPKQLSRIEKFNKKYNINN